MDMRRNLTENLDEAACWELLAATSVGRLAVDVAGQPDIFPINYVVEPGAIVFRTGAGTKLSAAVLMHHVAFEIDGYEPDDRSVWSVVVKGFATELERMTDIYEAEDLPLYPWVASIKPFFVRIDARQVTGRRFHVAVDVAPDASIGWAETTTVDPGVAPAPGLAYHPGAPIMRPD
ncbi:MAG: pyridoxamine 5'-phosphate oxidase family protein [Ilumatobacteraceae bacterium]